MLPSPVPADPGWDEDLAWLDRDPMTAAEFEASLDRLCELDEGPGEDEDEDYFAPLTAEELAEIDEAAADELLAAKAATTGRRGPGQPGSARIFPGESASPAAAFGPGMTLDVLPGCAGLAVAADAAAGDDGRFAGVSEAELIGVMCAWDRVEAHAHARKLAVVAELARRNPGELDQEFTARPGRVRAGGVPGPGRQPDRHGADPAPPPARHQGGAGRRDDLPVQGGDHRRGHRAAGGRGGPRRRGRGAGPGGPADPGRAARRDRPRRDQGRPEEGEGAAGDRGEGMPGWSGGCRTPGTPR